jgi:hypothetical protein
VAPAAAVGVDDDLAAGEPDVAVRAADLEVAGGIDVDLDVVVPPGAEGHGLDELLGDLLAELPLLLGGAPLGAVLGGEDDGVDADGPVVVVVLDRDLALGVGAQLLDLAGSRGGGRGPRRGGGRGRSAGA